MSSSVSYCTPGKGYRLVLTGRAVPCAPLRNVSFHEPEAAAIVEDTATENSTTNSSLASSVKPQGGSAKKEEEEGIIIPREQLIKTREFYHGAISIDPTNRLRFLQRPVCWLSRSSVANSRGVALGSKSCSMTVGVALEEGQVIRLMFF